MCRACQAEYDDPANRSFHAQPNACADCGLELDRPIGDVARAIRSGAIVAVKGLGGFHLFVDARNDEAIRRLRKRKMREKKPFALMCFSVELVEEWCELSQPERELLMSSEAPVVLLRRGLMSHQRSRRAIPISESCCRTLRSINSSCINWAPRSSPQAATCHKSRSALMSVKQGAAWPTSLTKF
jgi:hydrogenase maturation factor HypF (carbamoyltransferase family)